MIWHIFKKDWNLLWPFVAILAFANALNTAIWLLFADILNDGPGTYILVIAYGFPYFVALGMALVVIDAIHQDQIPGDRQDWLVRPIRRADLLLAKLLFICLAVLLPMVIIDVVTVLAYGFSANEAFTRSLLRAGAFLCVVCLPAAAVAAVTSNLTQVISGVAAAIVTVIALAVLVLENFPPTTRTEAPTFAVTMVALLAAAAILGLQYTRRLTIAARAVGAVAVLAAIACVYIPIPWDPVFTMHARLLHDLRAAEPTVTFDPAGKKPAPLPYPVLSKFERIALPLRITGVPEDFILKAERVEISLVGTDGKSHHQGALGPQVQQGPDASAALDLQQFVAMPSEVYAGLKDQPVRVELALSLTLLAPKSTTILAAIGDDAHLPNDDGWCKLEADANGRSISVGCLSPNSRPRNVRVSLEDPATGQRGLEGRFSTGLQHIDMHVYPILQAFRAGLWVLDPINGRRGPVDPRRLAQAQVVLKDYETVGLYTRKITIPDFRLSDWVQAPVVRAVP